MHHDIWQGHNIRLRQLTSADQHHLLASYDDSDTWRHADEIKFPVSEARINELITAQLSRQDDNRLLAVADASDQLVGTINVHGADRRHRTFEYGIHIFRSQRQKGYASEAIRLLLRYYFHELGYHRVWATVYSFNQPSVTLHHRLGFIEEGRLRQSLYAQNRYWDELIFGLLADEAEEQINKLPPLPLLHSD